MIEPTHLRIGNIISWELGTGQIVVGEAHAIDKDKVAISDAYYTIEDGERVGGQGWIQIEGLFPVPLTPEWLERMGFEKKEDWQIMLDNDPSRHLVIMHVTHSGDEFYPVLEGAGEMSHDVSQVFSMNKIQYVNQLQNLYWILTSQELTIKP